MNEGYDCKSVYDQNKVQPTCRFMTYFQWLNLLLKYTTNTCPTNSQKREVQTEMLRLQALQAVHAFRKLDLFSLYAF